MLVSIGLFRFREGFGDEVGASESRVFLKDHVAGHALCHLLLMRCL